ncbi:PucR family transcriptional regulator [Sinomonas notoginsengisoli]|uniref:PucR family transcriptional regulator n=1 Tax=Sinomonas notoginsengisoli TaxID=1457311 RepID=UPI001F345A4B|nr:helix-turn-helix domain-containing protein [Sinomonas notoginsengisoli]
MRHGVEDLVEAAAAKLGRGLSVEDLDGLLIAYSSNQSQADPVRVNFLLSKRLPADVQAWQLSHGIATAVRPVTVPANPELGMYGRVCVPLLVRGFRVGYLWVQQGADEASSADVLAALPGIQLELELIGQLLLESNTAESDHRRRREAEFLAAASGDKSALAAISGWREVHGHAPWQIVVLLDPEGVTPQDPQAAVVATSSAAMQATAGIDPALFTAGTETHAVVLFAATTARASHAAVLTHYERELAKRSGRPAGRVLVGISQPFSTLRELGEAYAQARTAAQAAAVDPELGELVDVRSVGAYQLMGALAAEPSSVFFSLLTAEDRNDELLPVLEMLYDSDGAVQTVADRLHVHRSTVYHRLARVRNIIRAEPLSGRVRQEIHLALKARRWAGRPRF